MNAPHTPARRLAIVEVVANPFRKADRRKQFDSMVADYKAGVKALFHAGGRENRSNNIGEAFWRGYHFERFIWDHESPLYVAWKAGKAIAAATSGVA